MNKKTINCINSTNGKSINENEKRSLRTRLLELKDEGYTAEEIKAKFSCKDKNDETKEKTFSFGGGNKKEDTF